MQILPQLLAQEKIEILVTVINTVVIGGVLWLLKKGKEEVLQAIDARTGRVAASAATAAAALVVKGEIKAIDGKLDDLASDFKDHVKEDADNFRSVHDKLDIIVAMKRQLAE